MSLAIVHSALPLLLLCQEPAGELATTQAPAPAPVVLARERAEVQGIAVELQVTALGDPARPQLRAGQHVRVAFRIEDTATGTPQTTLEPAGWLHSGDPGQSCQQKAQGFLAGALGARALVDLNAFYVLALNQDATVTVVDPLFGYGGTKLLALVELASPGEDWTLDAASERVLVSQPASDSVAVIDAGTWKVSRELATARRPVRLAYQPDGQYLWVACDGAEDGSGSALCVFDGRSLEPVAEIPLGRGHHEIAFASDGRWIFATNGADGTISVVDCWNLRESRRLEVGGEPVSVACSPLARGVYVVDRRGGRIVVLDERTHEERAVIQAEPGLGAIRFAPGGRLAFVTSAGDAVVHVVDASSNAIVQTADVGANPDLVTFTESLAYVRSLGSEHVLMIPLDELGAAGAPVPVVDFPGGQRPFGHGTAPAAADGIVPAPGGTAVLVANPADGVIYYYREGMAAPMGHFQNYGRAPRAVMVVDRSLREVEPGTYATDVELDGEGDMDVVFFLNAPRILHCFSLRMEPAEDAGASSGPPLKVELLTKGVEVRCGERKELRVRALEAISGRPIAGLEDLGVLVFHPTGWQRRQWARHAGDGVYVAEFTPPRHGAYYVHFECPSLGLRLEDGRPLILRASEADGDAEGTR